MALRLYANGKDFNTLPVVQNENGVYYSNGKVYYKPVLKDFDTAKLPAGYKKYTNGSHVPYKSEKPLDFSQNAGVKITASDGVKVNSHLYISGKKKPYGTEYVYGNLHFMLYHVTCPYKVGARIPKGGTLAVVNSQSENVATGRDVPPHIHACTNNTGSFDKTTIRQLVLAPIEVEKPTVPPVVIPPTVPETPPTDQEIKELRERVRQLEAELVVKDLMVKDRDEALSDKEKENGILAGVIEQKDAQIKQLFIEVNAQWVDDVPFIENLTIFRATVADMLKSAKVVQLVKAILHKLINK